MATHRASLEPRLSAACEALGLAAMVLDASGRIVEATSALGRLLGYPVGDLVGRRLAALAPADESAATPPTWTDVWNADDRRATGEGRFVRQDGRVITARLTLAGISGPTPLRDHVVGVLEDVSPLRLAEAALRTVFETTGDAVVLVDIDTRTIRDANPATCRLFGYTRAELVGKRTADLIHPASLEAFARLAGQEQQPLALVFRRRDGTPVDLDVWARDLVDFGEPVRLGIGHQIADHRRAYELLEGRVAQRTRELTALLQISRAVSGTLDLQALLELVLDQLAGIVEYTEASIMCVEGDDLRVSDYRGPHDREATLALRLPVERAAVFQAVLRRGGPIILGDVEGDTDLASALRSDECRSLDPRPLLVRSILAVPLTAKDRIIGQLRLGHAEPGFYTQAHADLTLVIANQAAVAIDNARLFEQAERRRRELEALYDAEEALYRTLEPREVLEALVAAARDLLGADKTSVLLWDAKRQRLDVQAAHGFRPETLAQMSYGIGEGLSSLAAQIGEIVVTEDAQHDPRISQRLHAIDAAEGIVAIISVPIKLGSDVFGVFGLQFCHSRTFTPAERRLLLALAQRAAIALHNARLFESERTLRERLDVALEAGSMGAWEWDTATNAVTWSTQLEAIHGLQPGTFAGTFEAYLQDIHPDDRQRVERAIAQALERGPYHLEYRIVWPDGTVHWLEASGRVIRDRQGNLTGMRGVCQDVTARKNAEAERARLQERERATSEARAALEERQRLARDLHDSVSQALYGIALGSQTALAALREDRNLDATEDATAYVHKLAEAAIAEMRALIFELRPESLEREGLVAALERQVASVRARYSLEVQARFDGEPAIGLETKEALYRIAQEGIHNVTRHAHATSLQVSLRQRAGRVTLEVADDGVGFDPTAAYPGHLGLTSMRERATSLGGALEIDSTPGGGTRLRVQVPVERRPGTR